MDAKPEVEYDIDKHQKIASLMSVDEIHFIDDTGTIYSGSIPKYFGYSFDSGEQMAFFKQMLNNKDLTLCQDVTPNTAEVNVFPIFVRFVAPSIFFVFEFTT